MKDETSHNSLDGIRVLDLTRVLAGPTATQILGDLGADVIKIEHPLRGDDSRGMAPPYLTHSDGTETSESAYWASVNRNKRSLALDITVPEGQKIVRNLVRNADIFIENFRAGNLERYGLDYHSLHSLNEGLIYCSVTGFGQTGPYAMRGGYDFLVQAMGGLMSITGDEHSPPMRVGVGIADIVTGLYGVIAILAALHKRIEDGKGQYIDMALFDSQLACLSYVGQAYLSSGQLPKRVGNEHPNIVPYQMFEAQDGFLILAVGNDGQFIRFCRYAHCDHLATDSRFAKNDGRVRHRDELTPMLASIIKRHKVSYWVEGLNEVQVPCGSINDLHAVFADSQVKSRKMVRTVSHPLAGMVKFIASPMHLSKSPPSYRHPPPLLGEHSRDILKKELKMSEEDINNLLKKNIINVPIDDVLPSN